MSQGNRRVGGQHNNINRHWESLGPNVRIRGSATQIHDKYMGLVEDARRNGDRVLVENLRQHAEHYLRIMHLQQAQRQERQQRASHDDHADDNPEDSSEDEDAIVEDMTPQNAPPAPDTDDADQAAMD